jgi:hypothetical protein
MRRMELGEERAYSRLQGLFVASYTSWINFQYDYRTRRCERVPVYRSRTIASALFELDLPSQRTPSIPENNFTHLVAIRCISIHRTRRMRKLPEQTGRGNTEEQWIDGDTTTRKNMLDDWIN